MVHIFLFTFTATIIGAVYIKFWKYKYWNRRGLAQFATSLPFGYANKFIFHNSVYSKEISSIYNEIKKQQCRHGGIYIFSKPCYIPIDPQIIKTLLNSNKCLERKIFFNKNKDNLFNPIYYNSKVDSDKLKADFIATMTNPRIRELYFIEVLKTVKDYIQLSSSGEIGFPSSISHLTTIIVKSLFFNEPVYNDKIEILEEYIKKYSQSEKYLNTKYMLGLVSSNILKLFFARVSNKKATDYFSLQLEKMVNYVKESNIDNTFLSCLIKSNENINVNDVLIKFLTTLLGNSDVIAPCTSFILFEVAGNADIQNKLRLEIDKYDENNLTLEQLEFMEYLDQVVKEALRKYPIFPIIKRSNTTTFAVPSSTVIIDEGTDIIIPVVGLHKDPNFYENPEQFNPERFSKSNLENFVDSTYIPFGSGERNCIGEDLAKIQIKLILFMFIKKHREIKQTSKMTLEPNRAIMSPNEFILKV